MIRHSIAREHWKPRPQKGPMLANSASTLRPQMGLPILPVIIGFGRFLIPVAVAGGLYYGLTEVEKPLGIDTSRIAPAAILGGIGAAALVASSILPDPVAPVATIVGILTSAASVAVLAWPSPPKMPPGIPGGPVPPEQQLPERRGQIGDVIRIVVPAGQESTGGQKRWTFRPQEIDFRVTNLTRTQRTFFAGVKITDPDDNEVLYRTKPSADPSYGRKQIFLPGLATDDFRVKIPATPFGTFWGLEWYRDVDVEIEMFPSITADTPLIATEAIPMEWTWANPWE